MSHRKLNSTLDPFRTWLGTCSPHDLFSGWERPLGGLSPAQGVKMHATIALGTILAVCGTHHLFSVCMRAEVFVLAKKTNSLSHATQRWLYLHLTMSRP